MSSNVPGSSSGFDTGPIEAPADAGPGGVCATCGRALPPPDLEATAVEIDQILSLEAGRLVPRAAWAGRPPDGLVDSLFGFLPFAKARRRLWERGQQLWTERMTAALTGPCADCQMSAAPAGASLRDTGHPPADVVFDAREEPTTERPTGGYSPPRADVLDRSTHLGATHEPAQPDDADRPTTAFVPSDDPATTAMEAPASLTGTPAAPGAAASAGSPPAGPASPRSEPAIDEHDAHTVMISALPSLSGSPRLVVIEGPVHGRQFSLGRQTTTIGRSIGCHVTVEADAVGYDHARVVREGAGWKVEPVGGASETYVNDEPIKGARALADGDVIRVGPARFKFEQPS